MSKAAMMAMAARCRTEATQETVQALRNRDIGHPECAMLNDAAARSLLAMARIFERGAEEEDKEGADNG